MEIPQGAKFLFVAIPLVLVASFLLLNYMGKERTRTSLTTQNMEDIVNGNFDIADESQRKEVNKVADFDKLEIITTKEGSGEGVKDGDGLVVHYELSLSDGKIIQSSYEINRPFEFVLGEGRVIAGWEEGLKGMKEGEIRTLKIPSSLGYGDYGSGDIPPKAGLVFKVELVEVK
jgi:FKBP-type peptidyl-prolyl cis-trans isomerase